MTDDRTGALESLLAQAGDAHEVYERDELGGVYDESWPAWYARYAVEHGLGDILGRAISADELGAYFGRAWDEIRQMEPRPGEPWATLMARRIAAEL